MTEQYDFSVRGTPRDKPDAGIFDNPAVSVCLNEDWIPHVAGVLAVLLQPEYWTGDPIDAQREIAALYAALTGMAGDCGVSGIQDLRIKDGDPCQVQKLQDGQWQDSINLADCAGEVVDEAIDELRSEADQPGPEAGNPDPLPLGGCQSYQLTIPANGAVIFPARVEPGDTVSVLNAEGAWSSGRNAPVNAWYCFEKLQFVFGTCAPAFVDPNNGDLLATAKEHALVCHYDGVYYDLTTGVVTIPDVAQQSDLLLMINDSVRSDNAGSLRVLVEHCKDLAWCYNYDFTVGDGGWVPRDGTLATYLAGQGWASVPGGSGISFGLDLNLASVIPAGTVIQATYNVTGSGSTGSISLATSTEFDVQSVVNGVGQTLDLTITSPDDFVRVAGSRGGGTSQQILLTSVRFQGTQGVSPFPPSNC